MGGREGASNPGFLFQILFQLWITEFKATQTTPYVVCTQAHLFSLVPDPHGNQFTKYSYGAVVTIVWIACKQFLIGDEFKFHTPDHKEGACLTRM